MPLTKANFVLRSDVAALQASIIKSGKRAELSTGERYLVQDGDAGDGLLLAGGNFANPIRETVIAQTVSGTLTAGGIINQIRDSGAFTIPLAGGVLVDTILVVELPEGHGAETPTATASGSDTVTRGATVDTSYTWAGAARLTLTSDGVDTWSL